MYIVEKISISILKNALENPIIFDKQISKIKIKIFWNLFFKYDFLFNSKK